jgi:cysteine desulfurase/selenocysteine lyase
MENGNVEYVPWSEDGTLDVRVLESKLAQKPDLVALTAASNFLGTIQPVKSIVTRCHSANVPILIDASQSIAHQPHDVRDIGCDYFVFSGHKIYGPSGIGILYVREDVLEQMPPVLLGGNMVKEAHAHKWVPQDLPHRFEAGTPNIEGAIGLGAAIEYIESLEWSHLIAHECSLTLHAKRELAGLPGIRVFGPSAGTPSAPLVSFQVVGLESGAVAKTLGNRANIIVRSGFLCAQPAHDQLSIGPTVRASFGIYNNVEEVDRMVGVLRYLLKVL